MPSTPLPISRSPDDAAAGARRCRRTHFPGASWLGHVLYILYCLEVGVFLIFLPWLDIWDNNYILSRWPLMQPLVGNPFFKGAVLGLGIVNILIGIGEIVQIRKGSKGFFSG